LRAAVIVTAVAAGDVSLNRPNPQGYTGRLATASPLLGQNLVRLVYLDEGGSDFKAPVLAVAGVLVHGDAEWPEVTKRIDALIEKYIPEPDRPGFVFHAKDIYHGARYFDRRKPEWADRNKRVKLLDEIALIIEELHLPVVVGFYAKDKFGVGLLTPDDGPKFRGNLIHSTAAVDCLIGADQWLAKYAPAELATVVHEDGTPAKPLIKRILQRLRSREAMLQGGLEEKHLAEFHLPLTRIIDTVHFADKQDAKPLQLADLCAFILARGMKDAEVPVLASQIIWRHLKWNFKSAPDSPFQPFSVPSEGGLPS
jgi:hypothetical protein